jgi:hypothetical protein
MAVRLHDMQSQFSGDLGPLDNWGSRFRILHGDCMCEDVSKSFRSGRLEREVQMVQLSATRCSCIVIL